MIKIILKRILLMILSFCVATSCVTVLLSFDMASFVLFNMSPKAVNPLLVLALSVPLFIKALASEKPKLVEPSA